MRDQLQGLLSVRAAPAPASAIDDAAVPLQTLLGYAKLAVEVIPLLRQLVGGNPASPPAARPRVGLLRGHPATTAVVAVGFALGAGFIAYKLMGGQRSK